MLLLLFPLGELIIAVLLQGALAALAAAWVVSSWDLWAWLEWAMACVPFLFLLGAGTLVAQERWVGAVAAVSGVLFSPLFWLAGSWLADTPYAPLRWGYLGGLGLVVALAAVQSLRDRSGDRG